MITCQGTLFEQFKTSNNPVELDEKLSFLSSREYVSNQQTLPAKPAIPVSCK